MADTNPNSSKLVYEEQKDKADPKFTWIASYPKSGNTWIRAFLAAYMNNGKLDINQLGVIPGDVQTYFYQAVAPRPLPQMSQFELMCLRSAALLHQITATYKRKPFLIKTHHANVTINGFYAIPPDLTDQAIYLIRDPRDVALSYVHHFGTDLDTAIHRMSLDENIISGAVKEPITSWSTHVQSWIGNKPYPLCIAHYEGLLTEPEKMFSSILGFLDIEVDERRLLRSIKASSFQSLRRQETSKGFKEASNKTERFFRVGRLEQWKQEMTKSQIAEIEKHHGETIEHCGYRLAGRKLAPKPSKKKAVSKKKVTAKKKAVSKKKVATKKKAAPSRRVTRKAA
jgi:hypothetical protein